MQPMMNETTMRIKPTASGVMSEADEGVVVIDDVTVDVNEGCADVDSKIVQNTVTYWVLLMEEYISALRTGLPDYPCIRIQGSRIDTWMKIEFIRECFLVTVTEHKTSC